MTVHVTRGWNYQVRSCDASNLYTILYEAGQLTKPDTIVNYNVDNNVNVNRVPV